MDIWCSFFDCLDCAVVKHFISWEAYGSDAWYLANLISKRCHVKIMINGVLRNYDISDVDISIHRACYACIYHMCDLEAVAEDLNTGGCVYFSNTALNYYDVGAADFSFKKFHASTLNRALCCHLCLEVLDLDLHGTNNSDFH